MVPNRRLFTFSIFAVGAAAVAPQTAHAQFAVFDSSNLAQTLITAGNSVKQVEAALTQIQQLQGQLSNQVLMLKQIGTDITGPIAQIAGQATQILDQAKGIGYRAQDMAQQFASLYPKDFTGASLVDTQKALSDWRGYNDQALQDAMATQNRIAQDQPELASQVKQAIQASQSAPGQTAAIQATNQLLATVSAQLTQLQNILITQARAQQTLVAQMQASQAAAQADSDRFWSRARPASRVANPGEL